MKIKALPSFDNFCRICSCKQERNKLKPIFGNGLDILEKITTCLPITIHIEDRLPHEICEKCLSWVDISFKLAKTARSSEKYFFDRIKASSTKIKIEGSDEDGVFDDSKVISLNLDGYECDICGIEVSEVLDLEQHIEDNHVDYAAPPNTQISIHKICSLCESALNSVRLCTCNSALCIANKHQIIHHIKDHINCHLFDGNNSYVIHKCESEQSCNVCGQHLATKCLLNRHIQHYCKELYFCPHCHDVFNDKVVLIRHVQTHFGESLKNECLACNPHLENCGMKLEHTCEKDEIRKTEPVNKYKCYICGQRYKRQMNLVKHCLTHESKSDGPFKCKCCDKSFEKERWLQNHYTTVHGVAKTWNCSFCGKGLSTKLSLTIHERIHTDVKPYVCEWCGNAFRSKANLIQHHYKHTGIRRHKCQVCGKKFSRTFFLKIHMRVHTGERPYECDLCGQRFTQVGDRNRHRRRHTADTAQDPVDKIGVEEQTYQYEVDENSLDPKVNQVYSFVSYEDGSGFLHRTDEEMVEVETSDQVDGQIVYFTN